MKRENQRTTNFNTIRRLIEIAQQNRWYRITYKASIRILNNEGYKTSRGNQWTPHRLVRMLQRNHISGLHGIGKICKKGHF